MGSPEGMFPAVVKSRKKINTIPASLFNILIYYRTKLFLLKFDCIQNKAKFMNGELKFLSFRKINFRVLFLAALLCEYNAILVLSVFIKKVA